MARPSDAPNRPASPLRAAREEAGLFLKDVAGHAGCSISLVSMAESGYVPARGTQDRIAHALGASSGSFWPTEASR